MKTAGNKPARAFNRFWRVLFWFTLIHQIIAAFIAVAAFVQVVTAELFREFHPKELGLTDAASLWLFLNMPVVWCALAFADAFALCFVWRWAGGLSNRRGTVVIFLVAELGLAALHAVGATHAAWVGTFNISTNSYGIPRNNIAPVIGCDVFLVLPSLLILARLIFSGWPMRGPGLCLACGYDLTGNTSRVCPECGTSTGLSQTVLRGPQRE